MAVVEKRSTITEISGTGFVVDVDEVSLKIEDEKTGIQDFEFATLKEFIGKKISFKFRNAEDIE